MKRTILFTIAITVLATGALFAQAGGDDSTLDGDEEALFGGSEDDLFQDSIIEEADDPEGAPSGVDDLLTNDGATITGDFRFSVSLSADPENLASIDDVSRDYTLAPTLIVDSRPDPDFRVLMKVGIDYTTAEPDPGATVVVEELFSDATLTDWLFMRAGKQNMTWGVGYFFSPADLVSLESIDPDDPEAEREGPVAVRLHVPQSTTNLYAYAILDDLPDTGNAGFAAKLDFVVAGTELTTGGYYERESVSGAMLTWSGSVGDVDLFAEGVLQYGSTFTIVEELGPTPQTSRRAERWFPLATAGFRYAWSDDLDNFNLSLLGQYSFSGEGYEDPAILQDDQVALLLANQTLSFNDLTGVGRHYAAGSLRWSSAFGSDLSPSAFWIGNLSDGSGRLSVDLSWRLGDYLTITPGYSYAYGEERDEHALGGTGHTVTVRAGLGSGGY